MMLLARASMLIDLGRIAEGWEQYEASTSSTTPRSSPSTGRAGLRATT